MKKTMINLIIPLLLAGEMLSAQVPQAINYQAVARDANGTVVSEKKLIMRFTVESDISPGTPVYRERDTVITNQFGLFSSFIGRGTVEMGNFSAIDWASGEKFLLVEMDKEMDGVYVNLGASQLLSVPFALYAANASAGATGPAGPTGPTGADGVGMTGPTGATGAAADGSTVVFNVDQSNNTAYLIGNAPDYVSGSNANPTLILHRGFTYVFNNISTGNPFRISSTNTFPGTPFNVGVTNQDADNSSLTFKVPMDAPTTLYYRCTNHSPMIGVIQIP